MMGPENSIDGPNRDQSVNQLMVALQHEVKAIAEREMAGERLGHTLQPTAIVNEAYLRLLRQENLVHASRTEFLAAAAQTIRRILIDHARAKQSTKRGGVRVRCVLDAAEVAIEHSGFDLLALNEVIEKLQDQSTRAYQVVMMRVFSGLNVEEVADALGVSPRTVAADWVFAKAWLRRQLADEPG